MGSCEEYTSEHIGSEAFKAVGIYGITQAFRYHIIKDHNHFTAEKSRVKLNDVSLADIRLCLAVLVNGHSIATNRYMVVTVDCTGEFTHHLAECLVAYLILLSCRSWNGREHNFSARCSVTLSHGGRREPCHFLVCPSVIEVKNQLTVGYLPFSYVAYACREIFAEPCLRFIQLLLKLNVYRFRHKFTFLSLFFRPFGPSESCLTDFRHFRGGESGQ